jgi:hypothetical protein
MPAVATDADSLDGTIEIDPDDPSHRIWVPNIQSTLREIAASGVTAESTPARPASSASVSASAATPRAENIFDELREIAKSGAPVEPPQPTSRTVGLPGNRIHI